MPLALDHIVIAARSLEQGARWCEQVLGLAPGPGGRHALMGTHNRLLALGSAAAAPHPRSYLEIIAIDPEAPPPGHPRWFGLDEPVLQAALIEAPRLLHWVARVEADGPGENTGDGAAEGQGRFEGSLDLDRLREHLAAQGLDPGSARAASRDTPGGRLAWRITVRDDGRLLAGGALPTLIAWSGRHPCEAMPPSALQLVSLQLTGLPEAAATLCRAVGVDSQPLRRPGQPPLRARFDTPRGPVTLEGGFPGP